MAMSVGDQQHPNEVGEDDWRQFAKDCGFTGDLVVRQVREMASNIIEALPKARALQDTCEAIDVACDDIEARCLKWSPREPTLTPEFS